MTIQRNLIEVRDLSKRFANRAVLHDVNLNVKEGEALILLGRSGAGKTTLLRCLNLLETPSSGIITLSGSRIFGDGARMSSSDLVALRRGLGMVFQNFGLFPHLTALENITLPLIRGAQLGSDEAIDRAMSSLVDVGLSAHAFNMPDSLSGGQQQRVAVARALALRPAALLFDEPTSALDVETTAELVRVLNALKRIAMTMVIVTHDIDFALDVADRICFMKDGVIRATGTPSELVHSSDDTDLKSFFQSYRRDRRAVYEEGNAGGANTIIPHIVK